MPRRQLALLPTHPGVVQQHFTYMHSCNFTSIHYTVNQKTSTGAGECMLFWLLLPVVDLWVALSQDAQVLSQEGVHAERQVLDRLSGRQIDEESGAKAR